MRMFLVRFVCAFAVAVAVMPALFLAGCEATAPVARPLDASDRGQESGRRALMASVDRWWQARRVRNHAVMYELYERGYRDRVDLAAFTRESTVRSKVPITAFEIIEVRIDGASATVRVRVEAQSPKSGDQRDFAVEERWILEAGVWHKRYTPPQLPFPDSMTSGRPALQ